jgi:tetratricopeptide (TPR) repeat protein
MAVSPWLALKQAREALRTGQPEEARRWLDPLVAEGYRQAVQMIPEVAATHLSLAERYLRAEDVDAAWRELLAAEGLNTGNPRLIAFRQTLCRLGLAQARAALEAGRPLHTREIIARLRDRGVRGEEWDHLDQLAADWLQALELADRGEFLRAREILERARGLIEAHRTEGIDRHLAELDQRHERLRQAIEGWNKAMQSRDWQAAVAWADEATAAAPYHPESRSLRTKAWAALGQISDGFPAPTLSMCGDISEDPGSVVPLVLSHAPESNSPNRPTLSYHPEPNREPRPTVVDPQQAANLNKSTGSAAGVPRRVYLWIDGVGGYLVCLSARVNLGQATTDGPVDIPLFADVARIHAELSRDAEGYVVESARDIQVNGVPRQRSALKSGDRLTLGTTCQFEFHLPVPLSLSARLDLVSGQRLPLAITGVLLMAESLILGPGSRVHVTLPVLPENLMIYRSADGLNIRFERPFFVDGRHCQGRSPLPLPVSVWGEGFSFALEPVGPRL